MVGKAIVYATGFADAQAPFDIKDSGGVHAIKQLEARRGGGEEGYASGADRPNFILLQSVGSCSEERVECRIGTELDCIGVAIQERAIHHSR